MECEFAKGLINLENKQLLNKTDNRRLCRLVVSAYFHKCIAHVCPVEGCFTHFRQRAWALMPDLPWVRKFTATPNYLILPPEPIDFLQEGWR
jgi:hypothetical protein